MNIIHGWEGQPQNLILPTFNTFFVHRWADLGLDGQLEAYLASVSVPIFNPARCRAEHSYSSSLHRELSLSVDERWQDVLLIRQRHLGREEDPLTPPKVRKFSTFGGKG